MLNPSNARDVFLIQTPYHLLLSILISKQCSAPFFVFISQEQLRWQPYLPFLTELYGVDSYQIIPQWSALSLARLSFGRIGAGTRAFKKATRRFRGMQTQVFVFNDSDVETQFFISQVRPRLVTHIEDGSFSYVNFRLVRSRLAEIIKTIASLGAYHSHAVIGATRHIGRHLALFPERVREELQPSLQIAVSVDGLNRLKELSAALGAVLPEGDLAIITVPLELLEPGEKSWYLSIINELKRNGLKVCIKAHPRQVGEGQLSIFADVALDPFVPVELFAINSAQVKAVVGVANTSSIVLRALSPSTRVIALLKGHWANDSYAVETLRLSGAEIHRVSLSAVAL